MISDEFALQLRPVIAAQRDLLARLQRETGVVEDCLSKVQDQAATIAEFDALMTEIESNAVCLTSTDLGENDAGTIARLYEERVTRVRTELCGFAYSDWLAFVSQCRAYDAEHGVDPLTPYESFLTPDDVAKLRQESYEKLYQWDKWDFIAIGVAGTLAALSDFLLVRIPKSMKYDLGNYHQKGSPLTEWLKGYDTRDSAPNFRKDWFARWAQKLEVEANVPFDQMSAAFGNELQEIPGMGGRSHRFQSLGHDPVLGFIFGVLDILRGTITGFSYDKLTSSHVFFRGDVYSNIEPVGIIEAVLKQIKHLISDAATPMGLPAPFLPLAQAFKLGSFGPKGRNIGELARWMYLNGYDLRHFLVGGIGPGLIEIILRDAGALVLTIPNDPSLWPYGDVVSLLRKHIDHDPRDHEPDYDGQDRPSESVVPKDGCFHRTLPWPFSFLGLVPTWLRGPVDSWLVARLRRRMR